MSGTVTGGRTRDFLSAHGLPVGDEQPIVASDRSFAGGGKVGIELSSINNASTFRAALSLAKDYGIRVSRVDECRGIGRLPKADIVEMVQIGAGEQVE